MKIAVLKERERGECRVAVTPETVKLFTKLGFEVSLEKGAGIAAGYSNTEYVAAGAKVSAVLLEVVGDADIVLKVRPSPKDDKGSELEFMKSGAILVGLISPYSNKELINLYKYKNISTFAMEFVPRITRAQTMDALSSQSNLTGYRAVIEASYHLNKAFPMMMTAAGTVHPVKVLVIGAGVAGLQAIATAKRLGAIVSAFDARAAAKEQVESLGGKFIEVDESSDNQTNGGYARETSKEYKLKQQLILSDTIKSQDVVITTALIPGKEAPRLINRDMVEQMKAGSVIVDLAAIAGGNCEMSERDKIIEHNHVKIIGDTNIISKVAQDASRLYAKNLYYFVEHLFGKKDQKIDWQDEISAAMLLTHNSEIVRKDLK